MEENFFFFFSSFVFPFFLADVLKKKIRKMGNEQSVPVEEVGTAATPVVGYHVLRVNPSSPGSLAGLVPFFDFIVSVGNVLLEEEDSKLVDALQQNVGRPLTLGVYSSRSETVRFVELVPRNDWGGIGLLGVSIRFNSLKNAEEQVWHVEQVYDNSPAQKAGLVAMTDYIVGTPDVLFSDEEDLYMLLRQATTVPLYVYSTVSDDIRIVNVSPNGNWGGNGVLGCELGYGLLHRIPREAKPQVAANAATLSAPKIDLTAPKIQIPSRPPQQQLPTNSLVQHPPAQQQVLPSNHLVQHPPAQQQALPSNHLVQHPPAHVAQPLPSNHLVQHPPAHVAQPLPSNHLVQHPPAHVAQPLPSNHLVQHPPAHVAQPLPSNHLVQHPSAQEQPLPSIHLVQHPEMSQIRIPESPARSNSAEAPLEAAPLAPTTPSRIEVPVGAPPTSSGKSLDEHKKKLAALQAKMNELRK